MEKSCVLEQTFEVRDFPTEKLDNIQFNDNRLTASRLRIHEEIRDMIAVCFGEYCLMQDGPKHYIAGVHMPVDDLAFRYLGVRE